MALNVEDLKGAASEVQGSVTKVQGVVSKLQVDIQFLVKEAQSKPKAANKIFGIDRMTKAERRAALHTTTLVRSLDILPTATVSYRCIGSFCHHERGKSRPPPS